MLYVEAPQPEATWPTVFLAGGITACPDWQVEMKGYLESFDVDAIVFNPRRANFPMDDPSAAKAQIYWEFKALEQSDIISFWFPAATLCPITLFELGKHLHNQPLIGIEPGYAREQDIMIQTQLELGIYGVDIVNTVEELAYQIRDRVESYFQEDVS